MRPRPALLAALFALRPWAPATALPGDSVVRVGLTDVTPDGSGQDVIAALRERLTGRPDVALPREAARASLEQPLDESADGAVAPLAAARKDLDGAQEAYSRFDYPGALERLRLAELATTGAPPIPATIQLLEAVNLLAGVIELDRGHDAEALHRFRLAHQLAPARARLDAGQYRPRAVALYAQAATPAAAPAGRLAVTTEPPGAELFVDGRPAGRAPAELAVEPGPHYVAAQAAASAARWEKPTVVAGQTATLTLLLARLTPEAQVRQTRAGLAAKREQWSEGAATLARAAAVDVLVLVRAGGTSDQEAAVYDAREGALGPWMPASPVEPVLAALGPRLAQPAPPTPIAGRAVETAPRPPPWYRHWWVVPSLMLVTAGAVLGGVLLFQGGHSTTYAIDRWCFGQTCAP